MLNKHILEAINRGIKLALDDYEDNDEYTSKQDVINSPDSKEEYNKWLEAQDNKIVKNLVDELIYMYKNISQFSNKGDLPKQYEQRTIEIFDELDKIYGKWGRFTYKRKIQSIKSPEQSEMDRYPSGTLQNIIRYSASGHSGFVKNYNLNWVDVSDTTSLACLFRLGEKIESLNISDWDVSNVTDMSEMFYGCMNLKKLDISNWNVSNVTKMRDMFKSCFKLKNVNLSNWNVSNVTDMIGMFAGCYEFEGQSVKNWNVSNLIYASGMFNGCIKFNADISNWNVSNCTNMREMFQGCEKFNQPIGKWDVSKVKYADRMLDRCTSFKQDLSTWDLTAAYEYDKINKIKDIAEGTPLEDKANKALWPKFYKK